jgi:integrase
MDVLRSLERTEFPAIGSMRLRDIAPPLALAVVRAVEAASGAETAHRVRQRMSAVFVYGIATGIADTDPAAVVKGALAPVVRGRMPAHPATRAAHRFLALTVVRPDNVHAVAWGERQLGGEAPQRVIGAARMKAGLDHVVPLSRQAVELVEAICCYSKHSPFLFPNTRFHRRLLSENALSYLLRRSQPPLIAACGVGDYSSCQPSVTAVACSKLSMPSPSVRPQVPASLTTSTSSACFTARSAVRVGTSR